jgi:hypothetical protein
MTRTTPARAHRKVSLAFATAAVLSVGISIGAAKAQRVIDQPVDGPVLVDSDQTLTITPKGS